MMMLATEAPPAAEPPVQAPQQAAPEPTVTPPPVAVPAPPPLPSAEQPKDDVKEIVVTGREGPPPGDPLATINTKSFEAIQAVDNALVGPVARGYKKGIPRPIRSGIRNVLNNLDEPVVFINYLLQLKPGKAAETLGRFAINSTIGAAGLFDVAKKKPFNLPRRPNGFAYTLGYYGVKPGPYLYLPLIGSTTVRDLFGRTLDLALLPTVVGKPFNKPAYVIPASTLSALDDRAEFEDDLQKIRESDHPYSSMRSYYLEKRAAEIEALHGRVIPPPIQVAPIEPAPSETPPQ